MMIFPQTFNIQNKPLYFHDLMKKDTMFEKNFDIYSILNQTSYHSFHWSINWCLFLYKNMKTTARRPNMPSYIQSYPHALPSIDTHTPISIFHFSTGEHILV